MNKCFSKIQNWMIPDSLQYFNPHHWAESYSFHDLSKNTHFTYLIQTWVWREPKLEQNWSSTKCLSVRMFGVVKFLRIVPPLFSSPPSLPVSPHFLPPVLIVLTCDPALRHAADVPAVGTESSGRVTWETNAAYWWGAETKKEKGRGGREGRLLDSACRKRLLHFTSIPTPPFILLPLLPPPRRSEGTEGKRRKRGL